MARRIIISSPTHRPDECRSVIWVNGEPIKQEERRKCLELMKRLEAARETLRRFHEESRPAFEQWLYSTFGKEITAIRELSAKFEQAETLITKIQHYKYRVGCSFSEAYAAIRKQMKRPSVQKETFEEPDIDEEPRWQQETEENFERIHGESQDPGRSGREETHKKHALASEAHQDRDARLRRFYLSLVKRLHPDKNPHLGKKHQELWHQVQEAYETKDLDRMETLSAMTDLYDNRAESTESLWSLTNLSEDLKGALRQLQKEINSCKKNLSWNFQNTRENPKKMSELHRKVSWDLEFSKTDLNEKLQYCENLIEKWKHPSTSSRARKSRVQHGSTPKKSRGRSSRSN
jgi:curved DNA-binding protein CbpA